MNKNEETGELIRSAGRRPEIPAEDLAAIKEAAASEWRKTVAAERGRRLRTRTAYAIAASLLVVMLGAWWWLAGKPSVAPAEIATVELSTGVVGVGDSLSQGDTLAAAGLVALRMAGGQSVRLEGGARLRFVSSSRLELERGAVYVDSGPSAAGDAGLEIHTPLAVVREIGTQYEVRLADEAQSVRVRVREGSVSVVRNGETHAAMRGEQLTLQRDGSVARAAVVPDGPEWLWILEAAPSLDIEGLSLASFLDWVSRETGWQVRYADEEIARSAQRISLHGTIEGLRPDESLGMILQGSGLDYRKDDGAVVVVRP
jgi:hypothetical protein